MNGDTSASSTARAAQNTAVFRVLARVGYAVLGVLHILIGLIAISIATGAGASDADQGGALQQIQRAPAGTVLLWIIVLGLVALAVWQVAEALIERHPDTKKKWGRRSKFIGTAVAYVAIAGTALTYALGGQSPSDQSSQTFSSRLLSAPAGVALLVLVGLVIAAVGITFVIRGITRAFTKHLDLPSGAARTSIGHRRVHRERHRRRGDRRAVRRGRAHP